MLSTRLQRTVVDRTGLTGTWDLMLTYTPEPSQIATGALSPGQQPAFDPNGPSIFTAVQEQLGLTLDATRGPVDALVLIAPSSRGTTNRVDGLRGPPTRSALRRTTFAWPANRSSR
jgi:uncharacterized protein (TIGR03435 family)